MATSATDAHDALRTAFRGECLLDFTEEDEPDPGPVLSSDEDEEEPDCFVTTETTKRRKARVRSGGNPQRAEEKRQRMLPVPDRDEPLTKVKWTKERAEAASAVFSSVRTNKKTPDKEIVLAAGEEYKGNPPTIEQARKAVLNSRPVKGMLGESQAARTEEKRRKAEKMALEEERNKSEWLVGIQLMRVAQRNLGDKWTAKYGNELAKKVKDHLIKTRGKTIEGLRSLLDELRDSNNDATTYHVSDDLFVETLAKVE